VSDISFSIRLIVLFKFLISFSDVFTVGVVGVVVEDEDEDAAANVAAVVLAVMVA